MTRQIHRLAALATAGLLAAGLAACSSSGSGGNNNASSGGKPAQGGTLKFVAGGGPTYLDTVPAYYTANYILERTYARQLLTYPTAPDPSITGPGWTKDTVPVPDIATGIPDRRQRRASPRRHDLHVPHQARRRLGNQPAQAG